MITSYISCSWTEEYWGQGYFILECNDTDDNVSMLQEEWYLVREDRDTAMVIEYVRRESALNWMRVEGYTTLHLLFHRILYKTHYVYARNNLGRSMCDLVNACYTGAYRQRGDLIAPYPSGITDTFETQFTGTNLLEAISELGEQSEVGFYMLFDDENNRHVFTPYKGLDRTDEQALNDWAIFSEGLRNLENATIITDITQYKNVPYVAGGGEGVEREWVIVYDSNYIGRNRREVFFDRRDLQQNTYEDGKEINYTLAQYQAILRNAGIQKISDYKRSDSFQAEVYQAGFGTDFYLGDKVTCISDKYGIELQVRITSYTQLYDRQGAKLYLTMGNPEFGMKGGV